MPKILQLNQGESAAYSPAFSEIGECRGKQRAEAVEPGSQEAQAEKESSREAGDRQDADRKTLKANAGWRGIGGSALDRWAVAGPRLQRMNIGGTLERLGRGLAGSARSADRGKEIIQPRRQIGPGHFELARAVID